MDYPIYAQLLDVWFVDLLYSDASYNFYKNSLIYLDLLSYVFEMALIFAYAKDTGR